MGQIVATGCSPAVSLPSQSRPAAPARFNRRGVHDADPSVGRERNLSKVVQKPREDSGPGMSHVRTIDSGPAGGVVVAAASRRDRVPILPVPCSGEHPSGAQIAPRSRQQTRTDVCARTYRTCTNGTRATQQWLAGVPRGGKAKRTRAARGRPVRRRQAPGCHNAAPACLATGRRLRAGHAKASGSGISWPFVAGLGLGGWQREVKGFGDGKARPPAAAYVGWEKRDTV